MEPRDREAPRGRGSAPRRRAARLARRVARGRRRGVARALRAPVLPAQGSALPAPQRARRGRKRARPGAAGGRRRARAERRPAPARARGVGSRTNWTRRRSEPGARAPLGAGALDLARPADRGLVGRGRGRPRHALLLAAVRGRCLGRHGRPRRRSAHLLLAGTAGSVRQVPARRLLDGPRLRHGRDLGLCARLHVRVRGPVDPGAALLPGPRSGAPLRAARRPVATGRADPDARRDRVVAKRPLHAVRLQASVRHGPVRAPARRRRGCRVAREQARAGDGRRSRARVGSGRAPRPAGPAGRSPRRHESLRTGARVVARDRRGVCRVHSRAAGRDPVRPDGDHPGRRRLGAGDRGGRRRGRNGLSTGHAAARDRLAAPGRDERVDRSSTARTCAM